MLLQTNSYLVPKEKRAEHARVIKKFRQVLARLGCDHFEVYEQVGSNWNAAKATGRFVQILRFRDRPHHAAVQAAERDDPSAQAVIREFCDLVNVPYQQEQGYFAIGFYTSVLPVAATRAPSAAPAAAQEPLGEAPIVEEPASEEQAVVDEVRLPGDELNLTILDDAEPKE